MHTKESLSTATEKELASIAKSLGILLQPDSTLKSEYITEILAHSEDASEDTVIEVAPPKPRAKAKPEATAPTKMRILINNQDGVDSSPFVKVCVNGEMTTIPRDIEAVVGIEVVHVLENAVITRFVQEGGQLVEKSARRFPFSVLGPA